MEKKRFEVQIIAECELEGAVIGIKKILSAKVDGLENPGSKLIKTIIATRHRGLILIEKIQGEGAE